LDERCSGRLFGRCGAGRQLRGCVRAAALSLGARPLVGAPNLAPPSDIVAACSFARSLATRFSACS
jgi:hypothetical protein